MSTTNYKVYLTVPPEPSGKSWTRFVCIGDTHSQTALSVPSGDVLIHAGDLSSWGTLPQLRVTLDWLCSFPHKIKLIIAGNHDLCLDSRCKSRDGDGPLPEEVDAARELVLSAAMRDAGIIYLDHESTEIKLPDGAKWKVYGSPAAPFYARGAFQYKTTEEAKEEWSQIPPDIDILITHTPPYGVLDKTRRGKLAGCRTLASRINLLPKCRLHVFGHIHEAHGLDVKKRLVVGPDNAIQQVDFISVNAATYSHTKPIIIDLHKAA